MSEKNKVCENGYHVYRKDICAICGHKSDTHSKVIHGRCVCEDCIEYICNDDYKNEKMQKHLKRTKSKNETK
ncbi:MAG: hypothetical protein IKV96_04025 [Firmicutes bacterium]|nr:hypothetical protein [Bacillota bacterium]